MSSLETLVSARCVSCKEIRQKRTYTDVEDGSFGSFKHVCHNCQTATYWNTLSIVDTDPDAGGRSIE